VGTVCLSGWRGGRDVSLLTADSLLALPDLLGTCVRNKPHTHTQTRPFKSQTTSHLHTHTQTPAQPLSFWSLNLLSVSL